MPSGQVAQPAFRIADGRISIPLEFHEFQSLFIVFPKVAAEQTGKAWLWQDTSKLTAVQQINGAWNVKFDPNWGGPEEITFNTLQDWSKHPDKRIKYYSGKAVYHNTFDLNRKRTENESLLLDLGVVKDICQVWLNGKDLGIVWTAPWQVDISDAVKEKGNQLKIEVINLWPNRLIGDAALPKEQRLTNTNIVFKKTDKLLPSGLLGPVTIQGLVS